MTERQEQAVPSPDAMTITQLAMQTGVPARRIRYYVSEGLLPPPVGRGRAAHYTGRHLSRLQQISALRDVNLSLSEIRDRLGEPAGANARDTMNEPAAQPWSRWEIVPGVEIHVRDDLDANTISTVRAMVGAVRHMLIEEHVRDTEGTGPQR